MPKPVRTILSTRELPHAVLAEAMHKGFRIECIPFIEILYADTIAAQLGVIHADDIFIFTSKHAVLAAHHLLKKYSNEAYCISGATQKTISAYTRMKINGVAPHAKQLCALLPNDATRNFIFCCGNMRMSTIPEYLAAHHLLYKEVRCYETTLTPVKTEKQYDAVLFYSPSAVKSYFSVNSISPHQRFYCIGHTTVDMVKSFTTQQVFIAEEPSTESLFIKMEQTI